MSELRFNLRAIEADGNPPPTTRDLSIFLDDQPIWPVRGNADAGLEIEIDDLLSHLTEAWKPLLLRQTYPGSLNPLRPSLLITDAQNEWAKMPEDIAAAEDELVEDFARVHNLARSFSGYFDLPDLWIVRAGNVMVVDTKDGIDRVDFVDAVRGLAEVGNSIVELLSSTGDDQWARLIESWNRREEGSDVGMLAWSTSLSDDAVTQLADEGLLNPPKHWLDVANDNDELQIAARMTSALPLDEIRTILRRVVAIEKSENAVLADLAGRAQEQLSGKLKGARPYEQGEHLATLTREVLNVPRRQAVDIFGIVEQLGIPLHVEDVPAPALDALAVWGSRHGPAILLNSASDRHHWQGDARHNGTARITLAHELCHLIADSDHVLSAMDVFNSRMPKAIEQRARSFGAELLLQTRDAADEWLEADRPRDRAGLLRLLDHLTGTYTISLSAASWKIEHGAREHRVNLRAILDLLVPQR